MRKLIEVGVPSGVQIVADVLAWSLFSMWVMGQYGTRAMAANTYMMRYMVVSFMPAFGVATAVTALVGRYIGRGEPDTAARRATLGFRLTALYMVSCGLFFFLGRHLLIRMFTSDPEILRIGAQLLVFAAIYQFFDAVYIIYNGALAAPAIHSFPRWRRDVSAGESTYWEAMESHVSGTVSAPGDPGWPPPAME